MELNKNTTIRFLSVLLITCSVLLAGCFDLEINQTINEDGTSKMEMVIDMTKTMEQMKAQMEQMSESMGGNASSSQGSDELTCDDFEEANMPEGATNPQCEKLGPYAIKVSYDLDLLELDALDIQESDSIKTYTFNMDDLNKLTSEDEGNGSSSSYSMNQMSPKDMGMTYIYTLTMPGKIIKSDIGLIEGNKVTIDVAEQYEQTKGLEIVSQVDETNPYVPEEDNDPGQDAGDQNTGADTGDDGTGSADAGKTGDEGTATEVDILDFNTWNSNMMIMVGAGAGVVLVIIILIIVLAARKGKKKKPSEHGVHNQEQPGNEQQKKEPAKNGEEEKPKTEEKPAEEEPEEKPKAEPAEEESTEPESKSSDEEPEKQQ